MPVIHSRLPNLLPWLGAALLVIGLCTTPLARSIPWGRFGELVAIGLLACGAGMLLKRWRHWSMASVLGVLWLLLLPVFAGVSPFLATLLMLLAAVALGATLFAQRAFALQACAGLLMMAAVLGWTLLLPIHYRWVYLLACLVLVAWRRAPLSSALRAAATQWRQAVAAAPRSAAFAVLVLGLASTACWLPTLQYDDLTYHLRLPWQLLELGVYQPAPEHQIWALAPWATDVIHAVPQLVSGAEARGPVNAFWLLALGTAAWQLAAQLGAGELSRWLAVAMVASLPLTAGLAGGMQTELPTAAVLLWMCALAAAPRDSRLSSWLLLAVLAGGLLAIKTMGALLALPVLLWALVRHPWPSLPRIALVALVGLLVGASSYAYATWIAGNPVLPLFNGIFHSPYYAPVNFLDATYSVGFGANLPWMLTFHSSRYFESQDGAAGVVLVGLAGLWLLALLRPSTRAAALVAMAVLVLPLLPVQYLRYAYPGMVLLSVVAVAALGAVTPRRPLLVLLVTICALNVSLQSTGYWMMRSGALKDTLKAAGLDEPLFQRFTPERSLAAAMRVSADGRGNVLVLDTAAPYFAEFGNRGRSVAWYAPTLQAAAAIAEQDASGQQWLALMRDMQAGHIILNTGSLTAPQRAALQLAGAELQGEAGKHQWWSLPPPVQTPAG